ncbi:MAG: serine hydrolase domain-containing protein [Gammaproteobacteria bacterium]
MTNNLKTIILLCLGCLLYLITITISYADQAIQIENKINESFQSMCEKNQFSGNVLVAIHGKIIFKKSCGFANRSFHIENNLKTKFNLGSVGKLFTSISIAQLAQKNKIILNQQAYQIIPSWLPKQTDKTITIEQLLIHASGLGSFMDDTRFKLGSDSALYVDVNDYKPLLVEDKHLFKPGMSQSYSNNGYILLGAIIESLSGVSYSDYVKRNIFDIANMKETGIWRLDESVPDRAEGYFSDCHQGKCQWKNNNFEVPLMGSPAGGAYSTVEDLFRFSNALHSKKLLNQKLTAEILSTDIVTVSKDVKLKSYKIGNLSIPENISAYGFSGAWNKFGFAVWKDPSLVGHTGGIKGASAFFATSPNNQYTIIILSNIDGSGPILLYKKIREALGLSVEISNY